MVGKKRDEKMTEELIITLICSIFASTGFWSVINLIIQRRQTRAAADTVDRELLLGLAHDRLYSLCTEYISRGEGGESGYITSDEYDNLINYISKPYLKAGGNGTGKRLVEEVEKLPIKNKK